MLFSFEWLKDYVEIDIPVQELAEKLTMIGHEVEEIRGEGGFTLIDVNIAPNRCDCLSYIGFAREIAMVLGKNLILPETKYTAINQNSEDYLKIDIESPAKIHRFAGKVLLKVKIGQSPDWMKRRLESIGVRALNDIVDITNYVLLETGHPMHSYDLALLDGARLAAREAKEGEKMLTLDGVERALKTGDIVIIDASKIVGLGGVMGGANTEISEKTKQIALEAAWFDPIQTRKTAKRLALSTDASYRFERKADIDGPIFAIERCCALISKIMKADILSGTIDVYSHKHPENIISFRPERARKLTAAAFSNDELINIFERLGFKVIGRDQYRWKVLVPSFRNDLEKEVDLIEEATRFYRFERIPLSLPEFSEGAKKRAPRQSLERNIKLSLTGAGLSQVLNYSFADDWENDIFTAGEGESVRILNPIAENMGYLRNSILPGLLRSAVLNYNYGIQDIPIFEIGKTFFKTKKRDEVGEKTKLGIVLSGRDYPVHWSRKSSDYTFYHLKGLVEALPVISRLSEVIFKKTDIKFLDYGQSATAESAGKTFCRFGKLSGEVSQKYNIKFDAFIAEIEIDILAELMPGEERVYSLFSRYPAVSRDIALILDDDILYQDLISFLKELKLDVLRRIVIFDLYRDGKIPPGKKSIALNLLFLSDTGSFTGEEIVGFEENIVKELQKRFSAIRVSG